VYMYYYSTRIITKILSSATPHPPI